MSHPNIPKCSTGALWLRISCALALGTVVATAAAPVIAAEAIPDPRLETSAGASAQLRQAVERYSSEDPNARFRWLHGHVDSFTTRPRESVPDYAKPILAKYGLSIAPSAADPETTTTLPHKPRLPERSSEQSSGVGSGGGSDDSGEGRPGTGSSPEQVTVVPTQWYPQATGEVATEILAAFLRKNAGVFELGPELTGAGLPNLKLVKYGDGRHFRRAQYEQSVNGVPLLQAKTVVLFDLNWNVIVLSRQLATPAKLALGSGSPAVRDVATSLALQAVRNRFEKGVEAVQVSKAQLGIDQVRNRRVWEVDVGDSATAESYVVTLDAVSRAVLNVSDNTARFTDAQVSRWRYPDGNMKAAVQQDESGIYTHDDNTLVHDFFYMMNDDRNDGGTGTCTSTAIASNTTPNAYGTTTSAEYIRPTRRGDRNFTLWNPNASKGSFGESHVYFWAREYMQWQKQALVDLGVLTLGNFNNYTKALIIVNSCDGGAGAFNRKPVSTLDDAGEGLGTIVLPEVCRAGNPNCAPANYADTKSYDQYTYEGSGGYHFPGVIDHELNHFVLIDYFGVGNNVDCSTRNEMRYFQEGGLGRNMPQLFWHNWYGVGYLPDHEDKLFQSDDPSGRVHDESDAGTLNELSAYACGTDGGQPYHWGGVVAQPLWEIYHGQKIDGAVRSGMGRPAQDLGMIKSNYYAADLASASASSDRMEFANRFMEFWELFSTAQPVTKTHWCGTWGHHGLNTYIDVTYCN